MWFSFGRFFVKWLSYAAIRSSFSRNYRCITGLKKVTENVFSYLDWNISFIILFQNSFNHFQTESNSSFKLTLISVKYVKYLRKRSLLNCIYSRIFNRRFLPMRISFWLFTDFAGLLVKLFLSFPYSAHKSTRKDKRWIFLKKLR